MPKVFRFEDFLGVAEIQILMIESQTTIELFMTVWSTMETQKLVLEISNSLFAYLQQLAELKEESMETLATRMIASQVHDLTKEAKDFNELLEKITPEMLHNEIDMGEPVGCEVFW